MHRRALVCIVGSLLLPWPAVAETDAAAQPAATRIVLPPVVAVYEIGVASFQRHGEWSAQASQNVVTEWQDAMAGRGVQPAGELTAEQSSAIAEFQLVARSVARQARQRGKLGADGLAELESSLGPSLSFLAAPGENVTVVGLVALQGEQGTTAVASQAALMAGMLFAPGLIVLPTFSGIDLLVFEADARTGRVLWYEFDSAPEIGGVNTGDLRDADSTRRLLQSLAGKLPAGATVAAAWPQPAPSAGASREVQPLDGYFSLRKPSGWEDRRASRKVSLTRDGERLGSVEVRLTPRARIFSRTDPPVASDSTAEQYAQWLVQELQAAQLGEFALVESRADGLMAGRPAFRVRYLHREWPDAPMQETIVVGSPSPRGLLLATLSAPHLAYFERALPDFDSMLPTVEFAPIRP